MRRALAVLLGLAVVSGLAVWLIPRSVFDSEGEAPARVEAPEPSDDAPATTGARRSVLDKVAAPRAQRDADADADAEDAPRVPSPFAMEPAEAPALSGLQLSSLGAGDRERLKIPDDYGAGVLIERVHPDAPAAEAGMEPGDVIIRAMREDVNAPTDLERVVGQREHTVVIAVRDGQLMQLVIQKPYDGS